MLCKQYTLLSLVNIRLCKVYEKDFSLPTEIEKQRNQGSLFFLLTSENILKFTTISVKIGDGICTLKISFGSLILESMANPRTVKVQKHTFIHAL